MRAHASHVFRLSFCVMSLVSGELALDKFFFFGVSFWSDVFFPMPMFLGSFLSDGSCKSCVLPFFLSDVSCPRRTCPEQIILLGVSFWSDVFSPMPVHVFLVPF